MARQNGSHFFLTQLTERYDSVGQMVRLGTHFQLKKQLNTLQNVLILGLHMPKALLAVKIGVQEITVD